MNISQELNFETRKQAIKKFLDENITQKEICNIYNKSRFWFRYWLNQYKRSGLEGLRSKSRGWTTGKSRKYPSRLISEIINIRKRLESDSQEYYYGAENIVQELIKLGYRKDKIPSVPYIKKVLCKQGCVKQTKFKNHTPLKGYPEAFIKSLGLACQIDFIGYKRIHNSNYPIHFLALAYSQLKYGHIWRIQSEKAITIMPLLFDFWQQNPKPHIAQMDNDWAYMGSGSAQGTISKMMRFCLALKISPLFIPESSPWRNGSVEALNSVFGKKFWQQHDFNSLAHIDKELIVYNNRSKEYKIKRFNINITKYLTIEKQCSFSKNLVNSYRFKDSDVVYFIRLGRLYNNRSAVKILNYTIAIPEEFLNHYIVLKLHIASETVNLYQQNDNNQLIKIKKSRIKLNT